MSDYRIVAVKELTNFQKKRIWEMLVEADREFVPPLSERVSTTQKDLEEKDIQQPKVPKEYFEVMIKQEFLLVETMDKIVAFMSYIPNHMVEINEETKVLANYISTVIVDKEYRSLGLTEKLYRKMIAQNKGRFMTRTWSTNGAHLHILEKIGFEKIYTIENDRGNGIDTVYYVK